MIEPRPEKAAPVQLQVRTELKAGQSVQACTNNVVYWRDTYNRWYRTARQNGKPL